MPVRAPFHAALALGCLTVAGGFVLTSPAPEASATSACVGTPVTANFGYTGGPQTFTVPPSVTAVDVAISGASGGAYIVPPQQTPPVLPGEPVTSFPGATFAGGAGASFTSTGLAVHAGSSLTVVVGGAGVSTTSSYGGGTGQGGGGGSFVYSAPTTAGLLAAAGGGGGSGYGTPGGDAPVGPAGSGLGGAGGAGIPDSGGGGGGGLIGAGSDGGPGNGGGYAPATTGGAGGHGAPGLTGGSGGTVNGLSFPGTPGGFGGGGGGGAGTYEGGGGGGGGGFSGGAGGAGTPAGGSGGTSYSVGTMSAVGANTGDGAVTISYLRSVTTTFDPRGGDATADPQTTDEGCAVAVPSDPTRAGHTFEGWFTAATGGTRWDFSTPVTQDTTLYAHWSPPGLLAVAARASSTTPRSRSGWYRTPVTVRFTCTTDGADLVGSCPAAVTLTRSAGRQRVSRTVHATDGGVASVTVSGIDIDRTLPSLRLSGVRSGGTYARTPSPHCRATDSVSGVASCRLSHRVLSFGRYSALYAFRGVAVDRAGNRRVVTAYALVVRTSTHRSPRVR